MRIEVTATDVQKGVPRDCRRCPVALALRRAFEAVDVSVGGNSAVIDTHHYMLPETVAEFISRYDIYGKAEPFEFQLDTEVE